jgi:hypothetical protein
VGGHFSERGIILICSWVNIIFYYKEIITKDIQILLYIFMVLRHYVCNILGFKPTWIPLTHQKYQMC